jgi:dTDP-4-dehydrorhamnose reductase
LLTEAWNRYQVPIAITECHLGCTPEEQLRWFKQTWDTCCTLKENGMDLRGVTAWSLLGSYDWNSLLTSCNGHYEAGVFDVRNGKCNPTDLARLILALATKGYSENPLLVRPGWWNIPATPANI